MGHGVTMAAMDDDLEDKVAQLSPDGQAIARHLLHGGGAVETRLWHLERAVVSLMVVAETLLSRLEQATRA